MAFVPKAPDDLPGLVTQLTAETLTTCHHLPGTEVDLFLPNLKLEPHGIALSQQLQALGLRSGFDLPHRTSGACLFLGQVMAPR